MNSSLGPYILLILVLHALNCQSQHVPPPSSAPYRLDAPAHSFNLPEALHEISGLAGEPAGPRLMAVQDETGVLYFLDKNSGAVLDSTWFWKPGDYEGLEWLQDTAYVVKSSGTLYRLLHTERDTAQVEKYNTPLSGEYDVEGLGYDAQTRSILLACKAQPDDQDQDVRSIFGFSLATWQLIPEPLVLIRRSEVEAFVKQCTSCEHQDKLSESFNPQQKEFPFSPSAIAVHPISGHWYVLSSVGKTLLVMSPSGDIIYMVKLRKQVHPQPEGLWFDTDGTLYISNEGGTDGSGLIHRFRYEPSGR